MKERPILFSGPMVRAILEGRKTQTRRVMKIQPPDWCKNFGYTTFTPSQHISGRGEYEDQGPAEKFFKCPYGMKGDVLWVREMIERANERSIGYPADGAWYPGLHWRWPKKKSMPSIHMPRSCSRISLEITGVRVERLQDISEEDAKAEGWPSDKTEFPEYYPKIWFENLWASIHGAESWEANPFVWVIDFRPFSTTPY